MKINKFKNGQSVRWENKRVSVCFEKEKIGVVFNAILDKEDLDFKGNFIRGCYKQTAFALTEEAAIALLDSLIHTLKKYNESKN